jgi:two-component sensor histidine kinase
MNWRQMPRNMALLKLETGSVEKEGQRQKEILMFDWAERHGPPIEGPTSGEGFGGELLRRMVEQFGEDHQL